MWVDRNATPASLVQQVLGKPVTGPILVLKRATLERCDTVRRCVFVNGNLDLDAPLREDSDVCRPGVYVEFRIALVKRKQAEASEPVKRAEASEVDEASGELNGAAEASE